MNCLLDTHVLLWFLTDNRQQLSDEIIEIFHDDSVNLYFSTVSIWEMAIKYSLGKPNFLYDPKQVADELLRLGFIELTMRIDHVCAIVNLPNTHGDPFDRLLITQANLEKLIFLTADNTVLDYPYPLIRDVRR